MTRSNGTIGSQHPLATSLRARNHPNGIARATLIIGHLLSWPALLEDRLELTSVDAAWEQ